MSRWERVEVGLCRGTIIDVHCYGVTISQITRVEMVTGLPRASNLDPPLLTSNTKERSMVWATFRSGGSRTINRQFHSFERERAYV